MLSYSQKPGANTWVIMRIHYIMIDSKTWCSYWWSWRTYRYDFTSLCLQGRGRYVSCLTVSWVCLNNNEGWYHCKSWFLLLCVFAYKQLVLVMYLLQLTWSTSSFQKAVTSVKNAVGLICFHCIMLPFLMLPQSWEFCWRHLMPEVMLAAYVDL